MNFIKRLLVLTMLVGCTAIFAESTAPTAGDGTEGSPYQIANLDNLEWLSTTESVWVAGSYFIQTADIDATDTQTWNGMAGLSPIGNITIKFQGFYDGQGFTISNLYINRLNMRYIGLFGYTSNAKISNIGLLNIEVSGTSYVGGLVGFLTNSSTVHNCFSEGTISGLGSTEGSTIGKSYFIGGLIGWNDRSIVHSSYSSGQVSGTNSIGGLIGMNNSDTIVLNCFSNATVSGIDRVGGITSSLFQRSKMKNCYAYGIVTGEEELGGLIGNVHNNGPLKSSFYNSELTDLEFNDIGIGANTVELKNINTFRDEDWDFETYWAINPGINNGYPYLRMTSDIIENFDGVNNPTLPVELSLFTAIQTSDEYAQLNWSTASESNLIGYNVFRCQTTSFNVASRINSTILVAENSSTGSDYSYIDDELENNVTYYYWLESCELNNENNLYGPISFKIEAGDESPELPNRTELYSAYPNPFNPETTIKFNVKEFDVASLLIYNLKGQVVKSYSNLLPGEHTVVWKGQNNQSQQVSSGMYFYQLKSNNYSKMNKMMLMK